MRMRRFVTVVSVLLAVLMLGVVLFACIPSNPEKAKKNLEKAGYEVELDTDDEEVEVDGTKYTVTANIYAENEDGEFIVIGYFDKAAGAKAYKDSDAIKSMKEFYSKNTDKEIVVDNSSKIFYIGTKAAVKAAK